MEKFPNEILKKYAGIDVPGKQALREGKVQEFTGFPESLRNRFNVALIPDIGSAEELRKSVISEIEKLETEDLKIKIAGRDFPMHVTVMEGLLEDNDLSVEEAEKKRATIFPKIEAEISASDHLRDLIGCDITFKYLLVDKGNILLTSAEIPESILLAREELEKTYSANSLKPLPMTNILHMSIGRINQLPEDKADLEKYREKLKELRRKISLSPIQFTAGQVHTENAFDLLNKQEV